MKRRATAARAAALAQTVEVAVYPTCAAAAPSSRRVIG